MMHTFKNRPSGIIDYVVVDNKRIYVGDWVVISGAGFKHSVEIVEIDVTDFKQSICYKDPVSNKRYWPHRGDYYKSQGVRLF